MEKLCNKCQGIKPIDNFNKKCDTKDGYRNICKECQKLQRNKIKDAENYKSWVSKNNRNEYMKQYRKKKYVHKERKKKTIEETREYNRIYLKNKRDNDLIYKLRKNIQRNITRSFKRINLRKNSKTQLILGCTFEEFKQYLESKFEDWMNWDNYGLYNGTEKYGWDMDHIIPTSSAITEDDLLRLNHYTNLQPLCSFYNRIIKKGNII